MRLAGRSAASASFILPSSARVRRTASALLRRSSMVLASHTVQVTSEAMARPIITAFTMMSAPTNMPQGDRLRGNSASSIAKAGAGASASAIVMITCRSPKLLCILIS